MLVGLIDGEDIGLLDGDDVGLSIGTPVCGSPTVGVGDIVSWLPHVSSVAGSKFSLYVTYKTCSVNQ